MNANIMQKALGISRQVCLEIRCENNEIILYVQTPVQKLRCPCCSSPNVVRHGSFKLRLEKTFDLYARLLPFVSILIICTGWGNIFEYSNEFLSKFIEQESIKTVKDLKDYLEKTGNKVFLEE